MNKNIATPLSGPDMAMENKNVFERQENPNKYIVADILNSTRDLQTNKELLKNINTGKTGGTNPYYFSGTIPEEVLHNYLDRAVSMQAFSQPITTFGYGGVFTNERTAGYAFIRDVQPKFIGRMAFFWGGESNSALENMCAQLAADIATIHDAATGGDPDVICQGAVFEYFSGLNSITIPAYVLSEFGQPAISRNFILANMRYDDTSLPNAIAWLNTPDISKTESQMWFYYLATQYINSGCEAIHFGDVPLMNLRDGYINPVTGVFTINNGHYWSLLQKIRAYAATRNRGAVLCDAHTFGVAQTDAAGNVAFYYDPDVTNILPGWHRQLVFDFHSLGLFYTKKPSPACAAGYQPLELNQGSGLMNRSPGGLNPQGWLCTHNPTLNEYDNGGSDSVVGCAGTTGIGGPFYGWDNISWFASQTEANRNAILKYTYYRIKCLDSYAHMQIPARRYFSPGGLDPACGQVYVAYTKTTALTNIRYASGAGSPCPDGNTELYGFNQQETIKELWSGSYAGPDNWVFHDFTEENVSNGLADVPPASGPVFAGSDKIFFIATDGYVHGYIKVNGPYNDGTWLTVSPSYAAGIPVSEQVRAKSDLVCSPDGKRLLYIGTDGYVYGFDIIDAWTYNYFAFMKDNSNPQKSMIQQKITAYCCLTYATNDRIYYIGEYMPDGTRHVHGFQDSSGEWLTVSPSYAAQFTYGQSISSQEQAAGALIYDVGNSRLYYRGNNGLLYYYVANSAIDYYYEACPGNSLLLSQQLRITGNLALNDNRIYYVGYYYGGTIPNGQYWIHCLIDNGSAGWNTVSPTWSAELYNGQPISTQTSSDNRGYIAVSPDGNTIAYFGYLSPFVFYYRNIDGVNFSFEGVMGLTDSDMPAIYESLDTGLIFTDNNDLYCISQYSYRVHHYKYQEAYCLNPVIAELP